MFATREIAITNDLREITNVAGQIDEFCETNNIASEIAYAVNLSLEELLANTISYAYDDEGKHQIEVIARLENDTLFIIVVDDGVAFDPTKSPTPDNVVSLDEPEIGGLGILLINRMMDGVEYQRRADCNIIILSKSTLVGNEEVSVENEPENQLTD